MIQIWNAIKQFNFIALLVALIFVSAVETARAQERAQTLSTNQFASALADSTEAVQLIQLEAGMALDEADALVAELGYELVEWLAPLNIAKVQLGKQSIRAASSSAAASSIEFIEPAGQVYGTSQDPALADAFQSYGLRNIYAPEAWDEETGSSTVVIAVIDTGLDMDNVEFAGRTVSGYDFVNFDNDPMDDNGHGTHVSGTAVAAYNNGVGTAGVCGGCSIMPIKVLDENNAGDWFSVAQGIVFATDSGADIINLSLGSATPSNTVAQAIIYAQTNGILVIAAAGNAASSTPFYPAALDGVIAVSATKADNALWSISNRGDYITVAAPGDNIFSTALSTSGSLDLSTRSGTSMAAPHVAGLAGLLLSQQPTRTASELSNIIMATATDLGDNGYDNQFGYGLINVLAALEYQPGDAPNIHGVSNPLQEHVYLPFSVQN